MSRTCVLAFAIVMCGVMATGDQSFANAKRRGATIVLPKRDVEVGRSHEVVGKLEVPGQPVVLVKPHQANEVWWIQPTPTLGDRGYFRTEARFGGAVARRGDRFSLVVIVLQSPTDIEYLRDRSSIPELPEALWQSEVVTVVLGEAAEPNQDPVELAATVLKPQPDQKVTRVTQLSGRVFEQARPVVLVRVDGGGEFWWVQDPVDMKPGGNFSSTVRFGNDATPNGTKFRVVIVTPRSELEAAILKTGRTFPELPSGIPRSEEVIVQLTRPDAERVEGAE